MASTTMPREALRRLATGARVVARRSPPAIAALAGLLLLWSRLLPITLSLWSDEVYTTVFYIRPGPPAIFGHYIPNDHMLFELLEWATTNLAGDVSEAALRFWSVVPAIAAGVIMTWWLWRRLDAWVATMFGVLAASAPLYMSLRIEARTGQKVPVRLRIIQSNFVASAPGAFNATGTSFRAPGPFLVIRYRITNLGSTMIDPANTVDTQFDVAGAAAGLIPIAAVYDANCTSVEPSVAVHLVDSASPYDVVRPGQTLNTLAAYPLPAGVSVSRASKLRLTWTAPAFGASAELPRLRLRR